MCKITKLDTYNYLLVPGEIRIELSSPSDPIMVDIFSEISNSRDLIYVEDRYYNFLEEYEVYQDENGQHWLSLSVVEIRENLIPDIMNSRRW